MLKKKVSNIAWVNEFETEIFQSSTGKTPQYLAWVKLSKKWMLSFLCSLGVFLADIEWNTMHFEWSCFFKLGDQWWYVNSGDPRLHFSGGNSMLLRKADGPKDYTGKRNQQVQYDENFEANFRRELGLPIK